MITPQRLKEIRAHLETHNRIPGSMALELLGTLDVLLAERDRLRLPMPLNVLRQETKVLA